MDQTADLNLSQVPALPPPPGVVSNFTNPPSQGHLPKIVTYVTLPLMTAFLGLRLYDRIKTSGLCIDDFVDQAAGPHMWDVPLSKITPSYARDCTVVTLGYYVAAMFIKAAILAMYIRIFLLSKGAKHMLWMGIVLSTLFHIATIAVYIATCFPRPEDKATGGWLSPQYSQRTYNISGYLAASTGIIGAVIDFYILIVPMGFLWTLQMSLKRKLAVSGVFATGAIACGFSILSTVFRWRIATSSAEGQDGSWNGPPLYAFCIAEINVGIMCSCMPIVFVHFKGLVSWFSSWFTKLRHLTQKNSKRPASGESDDDLKGSYRGFCEHELPPPVQEKGLRGLKSMMRNFNRTERAASRIAYSEVLTVQSTEYDYHGQFRQGMR
ncbi:hypothetical protein PG993_008027 [Apiospora rasikravindrae]|uniref:Rhodopsin domain-containing protein n=1 Tax=Apiospora rasikravindrae TaxID=990691 RepID=A0ABR1SZ67_9PEZI